MLTIYHCYGWANETEGGSVHPLDKQSTHGVERNTVGETLDIRDESLDPIDCLASLL
jgi:hypothetical protein